MRRDFYYVTTMIYRYHYARPNTIETHTKKFIDFESFKEEWDLTLQELKNSEDLELEEVLKDGYIFSSKDLTKSECETIYLVNCNVKLDH